MNRITPDDVRAAKAVTGLELIANKWFDDGWVAGKKPTCGCPVGIVAVANGIDPDDARDWANTTYGGDYVTGFIGGYDDPDEAWCESYDGYRDGQAVRAAADRGEI
jgi:hypothetical protein